MVSIDNKSISKISNIAPSNQKIANEGLDSIFAELFSMVDMSSIEDASTNNSLITNKSSKDGLIDLINSKFVDNESLQESKTEKFSDENLASNDKASIEAAKSLISIFYKEILIEEKSETLNNHTPGVNSNDEVEKANYNSLNNLNLISKVNRSNKNIEIKEDQVTKKKKKTLKPFLQGHDLLDKENLISNKNNNKQLAQNKLYNENSSSRNSEEVVSKKIDFSSKKEKKKSEKIEEVKLNITYSNSKKTDNISKHVLLNERKLAGNIKKEESILSHSEKSNTEKKINIIKSNDTKFNHNNLDTETQENLDLLESSWGERFVRIIKKNVKNGQYKIDLSLEPKNLGKLKIEVELNGDKTEIKINADNKMTANILNENQQKLSEMMEKEQLKLGNFSSMMNDQKNSKNNSDKDKGKLSNLSSNSNKESTNLDKNFKEKKTTHNVDINA